MTVEIKLPVCDVCGNVGKRPLAGDAEHFCVGPRGEIHSRRRMRTRRFGLIEEDEPQAESVPVGNYSAAEEVELREYACPRCRGLVVRAARPGRPPLCGACKG